MKILHLNAEKFGNFLSPSFIIFLTILIDMTGFGIIIPLLPFYVETFQAGSTALGILVTSFAAMQFISSPILGRLSDSLGRRPIILFSILTSVMSFIIFAFANSYLMLLISRIVAGLATEVGVAQAYISDITTEKNRAMAMGRIGAAHGAGMIFGPALGAFLGIYGFSVAGFVAAAFAFVNLIFAFLFLPETKTPKEWEDKPKNELGRLESLISTFSKPDIGLVLVISFVMSLAFSSLPVIVPLLAMNFFGVSSSDLSIFFVYAGLIQIIFQGFLLSRISSRIIDSKMIPLGSSLMAIGIFVMGISPNFLIFVILSTFMILGASILGASIPSFVSKRIKANERGSILGITRSVMSMAMIAGPTIGGFIFEMAGVVAPFFFSSIMLLLGTFIGMKIMFSIES